MKTTARPGPVIIVALLCSLVAAQPANAAGAATAHATAAVGDRHVDKHESQPGAGDRLRMHRYGLRQQGSIHAAATAARAASLPGGQALIRRARAAGLHACSFDDTLLCGQITPPLDRGDLSFGTTTVRFVVAPHTGDRPEAKGAIFATSGGPGNSITGNNGEMYPFRDYVLASLRPRHDLVFIDQRGVGRSGALRCPAWQHQPPSYDRAQECARRFGDRRNFYSSAAVADDTDDIRAALGYDEIITMGGSYGGNDAVTYAMRHPDHTALVAAGSPAMPQDSFDPFYATTPEAVPGYVARLCERSDECHRTYPHPKALLAWMIQRVRQHPVTGIGYDHDGDPRSMRVTESQLLWWVLQDSDFPFYVGEVAQAAAALRAGDKVPLLRLAASHEPTAADWDSGSVRNFSNAASLLRYCTDASFPWDVSAPAQVRQRQYAEALAAQPAKYGIFERDAWAVPIPDGFFPDPCISAQWEHVPEFPAGETVDDVPTLVLSGDYDLIVPTAYAAHVTDLLTDSTLIEVEAAAHNPWFWRPCAVRIVDNFIRTGDAEDFCAGKRLPEYWQPGSFPLTVSDAPQADPGPGDSSTPKDRRIATVTVWSLLDTIKQSFHARGDQGRGLRGGTTSVEFSGGPPTPDFYHLHGVRFTRDVAVTGSGFWDWDNLAGGDFRVRAPGVDEAVLHMVGDFYTDDQRVIRVHGKIDGRTVRLTVPTT